MSHNAYSVLLSTSVGTLQDRFGTYCVVADAAGGSMLKCSELLKREIYFITFMKSTTKGFVLVTTVLEFIFADRAHAYVAFALERQCMHSGWV